MSDWELHRNQRQKKITRPKIQQEFSFYWLNLSLQEDSCIAKTEPDTSSSAVVIYSLKLHEKYDALKYVTGQKDTQTPLQHVTLWMSWGGSSDWLGLKGEEAARRKNTYPLISRLVWLNLSSQLRCSHDPNRGIRVSS